MLGQRVSNGQSNVDPTKYVAIGPTLTTLNQRLGLGWPMISVLVGVVCVGLREYVWCIACVCMCVRACAFACAYACIRACCVCACVREFIRNYSKQC